MRSEQKRDALCFTRSTTQASVLRLTFGRGGDSCLFPGSGFFARFFPTLLLKLFLALLFL
jgi:hypothetical protein